MEEDQETADDSADHYGNIDGYRGYGQYRFGIQEVNKWTTQ